MSCDAVTSSRATQLASTHGRWTFESQLACRVRRVGQRRMRDHEARISAPRRGAIATTWFTPAKVTEIGHKFCMVYSVVCPCAQPQGARPLRHRGRTGYCARCGRVTFIFRRKIRLLAVVTIINEHTNTTEVTRGVNSVHVLFTVQRGPAHRAPSHFRASLGSEGSWCSTIWSV